MKRTFKRNDGTEEVLEGTAEELAEYERKLNEQAKPQPKPEVLRGSPVDEGLRGQLADIIRGYTPVTQPWYCQNCFASPCVCRWFTASWGDSKASLRQ